VTPEWVHVQYPETAQFRIRSTISTGFGPRLPTAATEIATNAARLCRKLEHTIATYHQMRKRGMRVVVGEGQQRLQGRLGGLLQQPVAARRDHHRIQDHDAGAGRLQPAADGVDHLFVAWLATCV